MRKWLANKIWSLISPLLEVSFRHKENEIFDIFDKSYVELQQRIIKLEQAHIAPKAKAVNAKHAKTRQGRGGKRGNS